MPIHWDAGPDGAVVTRLLSEEIADIPKAEWDQKRFGYACLSQDDFAWLKATIEKACSEARGLCTPEQKKVMTGFFSRVERARARRRQ